MTATLALCIPTCEGARWVEPMAAAVQGQARRPDRIVVADSSSEDGSGAALAQRLGADLLVIPRAQFDHGGTRNLLASAAATDVVVFLTQDALPRDPQAFSVLVAALEDDPTCGVAYGRQVPRATTGALPRVHQAFNYPDTAERRTAADIPRLGTKAAFCSNAFAAYRRDALDAVGGFPVPVIGSEDRHVAARLLLAGWSVRYEPKAVVEHAHDHSLGDQVRRYFDIGVFHAQEAWFDELLGPPHGEGLRLVRSQMTEVRRDRTRFGAALVVAHAAAALTGFWLGRGHRRLPRRAQLALTTAPAFWGRERQG